MIAPYLQRSGEEGAPGVSPLVIKLAEQTVELYQRTESLLGSRDDTFLEEAKSTLEGVKKQKVSVGCFAEPGLGKSSVGNW